MMKWYCFIMSDPIIPMIQTPELLPMDSLIIDRSRTLKQASIFLLPDYFVQNINFPDRLLSAKSGRSTNGPS